MSEPSSGDLKKYLASARSAKPIVFLSEHADILMVIQQMKLANAELWRSIDL